jgi:hypothetical protein
MILACDIKTSQLASYRTNLKNIIRSWTSAAHAWDPSYSGSGDQEDCSLKPAWANSPWDTISKKPIQKKKKKAQGVGPDFKP